MGSTLRAGLAVAAVALAAGLNGTAQASAGEPDHQLLKSYEPVLVFHPQELFRPTKVQSFVADSELERFTGSSQQQLPLDAFWTVVDPDPEPGELGSLAPGVYRLDQVGCSAAAALAGRDCYAAAWAEGSGGDAVYGRVVRTETRIVLQYWLFYYDNPLLLPVPGDGTVWQSHEGDWELVNVILDADGRPLEAAYSQHCSGQRRAWGSVEKREGTHPVAYVALGSHANYFQPGLFPITCLPSFVPRLPFIVDRAAEGPTTETTIHKIEGMEWSEFPGFWGESEYFFSPVAFPPLPANTPFPGGTAPASPPLQATWNVNTILGWPLVP